MACDIALTVTPACGYGGHHARLSITDTRVVLGSPEAVILHAQDSDFSEYTLAIPASRLETMLRTLEVARAESVVREAS